MTLTEQWKKGELKDGYYYAEEGGEELIIHIQGKNGSVMGDDFNLEATDWIKPIAPVPSYEEWQELKEFADYSLHNRDELTRQINFWMDKHTQIEQETQQLKELLKECGKQLYEYSDVCLQEGYEIEREEVLKLKTKIDNAIGEKNAKHYRTSEGDL